MHHLLLRITVCSLFFLPALLRADTRTASLRDLTARLASPPASTPGASDGLLQEMWYDGEPLKGKPTRIYSWLGRPAGVAADKKAPAMLLVHGGGGRAFKDWAKHWAERGYVALAMDTGGQGPDGQPHPQGGPDQSDGTKFRPFSDAEIPDMWTWHAVGAVVRGHALLASLPEVDSARVGITGISWGGYLTCLTAGIDPALKVAVPVYGCGFLGENSFWRDRSLAALDEAGRTRWLGAFDPSVTVGSTACPILFLNGTHDFAYPPDSYRKTYRLVKPELRTLSVRVDLDHGHIWTFPEVDAFVDSVLRPEQSAALVRIGDITQDGTNASARVLTGTPAVSAELHFTIMTGTWQQRQWRTSPALVKDGVLSAPLPAERPLTFFFTAKDSRGLITSSSYAEIGTSENTATQPKGKLENDFYDWQQRHEAVMALKATGNPDIVMIGDSITHMWGGEPVEPKRQRGQDSWQELFAGRRVFNLGFGWDRTQNVLQRIRLGELAGLRPKLAVLHIGTNNFAQTANARANTAEEIAEGIRAILEQTKAQCPGVKLVLMAMMPRGAKADDPMRARVAAVNRLLPEVAKSTGATLVDITDKLHEPDGSISRETMPDALHPGARGYRIWAEALRPHLP